MELICFVFLQVQELQEMAAKLDDDAERLVVQKNILDFHAEMVLLLHYSVLNLTGAFFFLLICSNIRS